MAKPELSRYMRNIQPSAIRAAQIKFSKRKDSNEVISINTAIGNVTLPMHPAMQKRMFNLNSEESPFKNGVAEYSSTVGIKETRNAFLHILESSGIDTNNLHVQITDGGSQAMELAILAVCGDPGSNDRPLLLIDPAYTNYKAIAERIGRATVSVKRELQEDGTFTLPKINEIEDVIKRYKPGAMVIIPYDNPTGQFLDQEALIMLGRLCVKHGLWIISDEAYRELFYVEGRSSSVWRLTNKDAEDIEGRRISIESASKVWNACGIRTGAIITDNEEFHDRSVAENTANLCPPVIGQYIFGGLMEVSKSDLQRWYEQQREYYKPMLSDITGNLKRLLPGIIVSRPDASLYSVVDVRNIVDKDFDAQDFMMYCASKGKVEIDGRYYTLLVSTMAGFYNVGGENPGKTQMRIAYVALPEEMKLVPQLFSSLLNQFLKENKVKSNKE